MSGIGIKFGGGLLQREKLIESLQAELAENRNCLSSSEARLNELQ